LTFILSRIKNVVTSMKISTWFGT